MYRITQLFDDSGIGDVYGEVRASVLRMTSGRSGLGGQSVAVAVGSRGISSLVNLVRGTVDALRELGMRPFIIPAMGSHGGGTDSGQAAILKGLGISEAGMGVPVVPGMEVVSLGRLSSGAEVFFSRSACEADHVVVISRVKPHTLFRSDVESGLCKLLAIGCGKHRGAQELHKYGVAGQIVPAAARILERTSVLCGVAVVENGYHRISRLEVVGADSFADTDRRLLVLAKQLLPKIPLDDLDILIVDEIGKNISGGGMDPNVYGFWRRDGGPRVPDYRTILILDLTEESHGNATGIGMADIITRRLAGMVDWNATYLNAIASGVFRACRMPLVMPTDRAALNVALDALPNPDDARMVRIVNTLELSTFWASARLLPELRAMRNIVIGEKPVSFGFSEAGRLLSF